MSKVLFIDGVDKIGKSTLIQQLKNKYESIDFSVTVDALLPAIEKVESIEDKLSVITRQWYTSDHNEQQPTEAVLLMAAAVMTSLKRIANHDTDIVLVDRSLASFYVYQFYLNHVVALEKESVLHKDAAYQASQLMISVLRNRIPKDSMLLQLTVNSQQPRMVAEDEQERYLSQYFNYCVTGFDLHFKQYNLNKQQIVIDGLGQDQVLSKVLNVLGLV